MGTPGPPDGSGGPHFFVADLAAPVLDPDDHHHASRVLRLRPGDALTVGDGAGRWRPARFGEALEPDGDIVSVPPPVGEVAVGFALVKGGKPELVVQKLVELGVDRILPFTAERSVVRWDPTRAARAEARWAQVARAAAQQCRRVWPARIEPIADFAAVARPPAVLADPGGRPPRHGDGTVLVGPEGGWSHTERERGLERVALGAHVLRAETAAIAAAAILGGLRDGRVAPAAPGDVPLG